LTTVNFLYRVILKNKFGKKIKNVVSLTQNNSA
jgi:hypothetical protein